MVYMGPHLKDLFLVPVPSTLKRLSEPIDLDHPKECKGSSPGPVYDLAPNKNPHVPTTWLILFKPGPWTNLSLHGSS